MKKLARLLVRIWKRRRESSNCGVLSRCAVSLIDFSVVDSVDKQDSILMPSITQTDTVKDIKFSERLTTELLEAANILCESLTDVLTDILGTTNLVEHKINVTSSEPVRVKPYPVSRKCCS